MHRNQQNMLQEFKEKTVALSWILPLHSFLKIPIHRLLSGKSSKPVSKMKWQKAHKKERHGAGVRKKGICELYKRMCECWTSAVEDQDPARSQAQARLSEEGQQLNALGKCIGHIRVNGKEREGTDPEQKASKWRDGLSSLLELVDRFGSISILLCSVDVFPFYSTVEAIDWWSVLALSLLRAEWGFPAISRFLELYFLPITGSAALFLSAVHQTGHSFPCKDCGSLVP